MDSDGTCENSQVSAASCKLMPLGWANFWMIKTCKFSQVSIAVHGRPWDIKVPSTLFSLLLINIVGQVSLDDQSTICQVSILHSTHSGYYRRGKSIESEKVHRFRKSPSFIPTPREPTLASRGVAWQTGWVRILHKCWNTGTASDSDI